VGQGAVKKRWGVKFYALATSVCAHVLALSIFAAVKLRQSPAVPLQSTTAVSISQATRLAQTPAITPKPKVVSGSWPDATAKGRTSSSIKSQIPNFTHTERSDESASEITGPNCQSTPPNDVRSEPAESPATNETQTAQAEFFGSASQGRKICYVVDCSGSMQGLWGQVKAELFESIGQLQPDQYFSVIIFGGGSVLESGCGVLVRATEQAKKDAYNLITSVRPRGGTNATAALEDAIKITDRSGAGPSVIYFLTDGFELSEQDNSRFVHQVMVMLRSFSSQTRINTIGFWCEERDRRTLELIARESGGEFTFIGQAYEKQ
jgi:Mg-chelatase subunit ChlD